MVFCPGPGFREVSGHADSPPGPGDDLDPGPGRPHRARRAGCRGATVIREPATEPWGPTQTWIQGPDGALIVLAGVPAGHPLRRDPRPGDGRVRANARVQAGTSEAAGALT